MNTQKVRLRDKQEHCTDIKYRHKNAQKTLLSIDKATFIVNTVNQSAINYNCTDCIQSTKQHNISESLILSEADALLYVSDYIETFTGGVLSQFSVCHCTQSSRATYKLCWKMELKCSSLDSRGLTFEMHFRIKWQESEAASEFYNVRHQGQK